MRPAVKPVSWPATAARLAGDAAKCRSPLPPAPGLPSGRRCWDAPDTRATPPPADNRGRPARASQPASGASRQNNRSASRPCPNTLRPAIISRSADGLALRLKEPAETGLFHGQGHFRGRGVVAQPLRESSRRVQGRLAIEGGQRVRSVQEGVFPADGDAGRRSLRRSAASVQRRGRPMPAERTLFASPRSSTSIATAAISASSKCGRAASAQSAATSTPQASR